MPSWVVRRRRGLAVLGLIVGVVVAFFALLAWKPWDARMGAEEAALALQREEGGGPYACERTEYGEDETVGLEDVDYFCVEERPQGRAFWLGTDGDEITGVMPAG